MLFNLAPDLQLDYNKITDTANLIVGKSGSKDSFVYAIDTLMFHEMLDSVVKISRETTPQPITIYSPYVNNNDTIAVSAGLDYIRVSIKCKFQPFSSTTVQAVEKTFNIKPKFAIRFVEAITGDKQNED